MNYDVKLLQEASFAILIAFLVYALTEFTKTTPETDWLVWLQMVVLGGARASAAVAIAWLTRGKLTISKS